MSLKKLFEKNQSSKILASASLNEKGSEVESERYIRAKVQDIERFEPEIDFTTASNFVKYGSAERYYVDAITRIYNEYPYDGALSEKQRYENSSSYLDKYVFDKIYPRTNGHIIMSADGWGQAAAGSSVLAGYGLPATAEYIMIYGGPHTASDGVVAGETYKTFADSNLYDTSKKRASNLQLDLSTGNTIEFWLQKPTGSWSTSLTKKEIIFDVWNSATQSVGSYGRLRIEITGATSLNDTSPFLVTVYSGSSGYLNVPIGDSLTTSSLNAWHHYAFVFENTGSDGKIKFYQDGNLLQTVVTGTSINEITGGLKARIGALLTAPTGVLLDSPTDGWGKLSASIDEFRFWKDSRSSAEVGKNWWTQVNGGTNTDDANVDLGIYYKFNEGTTQTSSTDATILDYSGRISNGDWIGYPGTHARLTSSAMVIASASSTEFRDPIIYDFHPDVRSTYSTYRDKGATYDYTNNSNIINSIPMWIRDEEDSRGQGHLGQLVQILSSYFDTLHAQIAAMPKLRNMSYPSSSYKPLPFAKELLSSQGLTTSEILIDSDILEKFLARNDDFDFTKDLSDIKNLIYINIYNNLTAIYKSKGTEKSFRNLIRCFGVDDELINIRLYANNSTYELLNNYRNTSTKKKIIDFNGPDRAGGVVYQYEDVDNGDSVGFISGSEGYNLEAFISNTAEVDIVFPKKPESDAVNYFDTNVLSSSLFGMHEADGTTGTNLSWRSPDSASFQILALRDKIDSPHARFMLTSSLYTFNTTLTSSLYKNLYDNNKWTFAIRLKPNNSPVQGIVSGTLDDDYKLEFHGIQLYGDLVENEFTLTASVSTGSAFAFLHTPRRLFVGAHRENITGTIQQKTDVKVLSAKYWYSYLSDDEIKSHARDPRNFGVDYPMENAFFLVDSVSGSYIPKAQTLALHWDFEGVTGSGPNSDGTTTTSDATFVVKDLSSGSSNINNRYSWVTKILNRQHTGQGNNFLPFKKDVVNVEYIFTNRQQLPDVNNSSDLISIGEGSDKVFLKTSQPIDHYFMFEKSMYSVISDEILKFFSGIVEFNNLIGEPVHRYRGEYKGFRILRQIFFERMNNTPDLEKFLEYFKWIDNSLSLMITELIPANANFSDGVLNIIESHILERSKHRHKFPTLEMKHPDPESAVLGINELLYNWKFNHHPLAVSNVEQTGSNCQWWKERVKRVAAGATSGDATVDGQRDTIQEIITTHVSRSAPVLAKSDGTTYTGSTFVLRTLSEPQRFSISRVRELRGGINFNDSKKSEFVFNSTYPHGPTSLGIPLNVLTVGLPSPSTGSVPLTVLTPECVDELVPNVKKKLNTSVQLGRDFTDLKDYGDILKGAIALPFNIVSSSVRSGYSKYFMNGFATGANAVNLHNDSYGPLSEIPMQGPFTEKYVGGHQSRHVDLNVYNTSLKTEDGTATLNNLHDEYSRPEAWQLLIGGGTLAAGAFGFVGADYGGPYPDPSRLRATKYRDEYAKRPVNIRNIQQTTGSGTPAHTVIGNYTNMYEVVNAGGRSLNSSEFTKNGGTSLPSLLTASGRNLTATTNINSLFGPSPAENAEGNFFGRKNSDITQTMTSSNRFPTTNNKKITNFSSSNIIIANKFSAPGGPEVQSLGYLDLKSQEYSPYNAIPFRNLSVRGSGSGESSTIRVNSQIGKREGLRTLLTRHCGKFGIDSEYGTVLTNTYPTTASIHKIPRNRLRRYSYDASAENVNVSLGFANDNFWVQHAIPRTDFQYTWLTASLGSKALDPAEYTSGSFTGYIPRSGLVISNDTFVSAVNFPEFAEDISSTL